MANQHRPWTEAEDYYVLDNPHLSAREVAEAIGRTRKAVGLRRDKLQKVEPTKYTASPSGLPGVGKRILVAGTCSRCGLLLDGSAFPGGRSGAQFTNMVCSYCKAQASHRRDRDWPDRYRQLQAYTAERAERRHQPITDHDLKVWTDSSKSIFEMALATQRSYGAVASNRSRLGLTPARPEPEDVLWIIQLPQQAAA